MNKDGMWMVYDSEDGLICVLNYEKSLEEYEEAVQRAKDYVSDNGEFDPALSERVILARIERDLRPEQVEDELFDWKEDIDEFTPVKVGEEAQ
ncbi:hypothetical protein [Paenibacillus sp. FSL M7-0896]|uniref:hypothetical protein n=1 Tax=unclassified Paenibacillus TaxID=185978 RepID=UPI0030DC84E4